MDVQKVAIDLIVVKNRYRQDLGDLSPLQESIKELGLLHPITVTPSWVLLCGGRRLQACKNLGMAEIPAQVIDVDSLRRLKAEHDENVTCLPMKNSDKLKLAKDIESSLKAQHGERRGRPKKTKGTGANQEQSQDGDENKDSLTNGKNTEEMKGSEIVADLPQLEDGDKTRDAVARAAGFKNATEKRQADKLADHGSQDLCDAVDDGVVALSDAVTICEEEHDIQDEAVKRVLYGNFKTVKAAAQAIKAEREERSIEIPAVVDVNGVNVPDTLREYYDATVLFDEVVALMKQAKAKLNELDRHPISNYRTRGQLQSYCKSIEAAMAAERFGMVCPSCEGIQEGNCNCCSNVRWFSAIKMDSVDLKKWRK